MTDMTRRPIQMQGTNLLWYNRREKINYVAGAMLMASMGFVLALIFCA